MKIPELSHLLAYENPTVVQYFSYKHASQLPVETCRQHFKDLLAWLWLNAYRQKNNKSTYLFGPLLIIDELWHCFILHTKDYMSFCSQYFGEYFHHHIEPPGYEHELHPDELADYLNDCFELLGEDWVNRHFAEAFS